MEGNTADRREIGDALGVESASGLYARAITALRPEVAIDVAYAADPGDWLPAGRTFADYAGLVIGGSSLHAYDAGFAVTNQIAMLEAACEAGLPVLGSCWGLQIAAIAAGGTVGRSPNGREIGIARKIARTDAGRVHPFLAGKPFCYDAPCIHYDEVTALPAHCTVLASNRHSAVQAAVVPIANSEVWAVQYHPEFDLAHIANLYRLYASDMIAQGFFADDAALASYRTQIEALARRPDAADLRWRLGIDGDVLDDAVRRAEIAAWLDHCLAGPAR